MSGKLKMRNAVVLSLVLVAWITSVLPAESPPADKLRKVTADEIRKIEDAMPDKATVKPAKPRKALVFWRCEGFYHGSIPVVNKALEIMGEKTGAFAVTMCTDDYSVFTAEKLRQFDVVILNNTTHLKFNPKETPERCKALMDFVKKGKGIVGVHAATDNFYEWEEGMEMMGGKFTGHPWTSGGTWAFKIDQPDHPLMAAFKGKGFKAKDEIYRTDPPLYSREKQLVLMSLDMSDPATKAKAQKPEDADVGISWIKDWGEGRVFYCSLGHNNEIFWTPAILQHYADGIQFALGDYKVDTTPKPISSGKGSPMAEEFAKVKSYDWGQSRAALSDLEEAMRKAHGNAAQLRGFEKGLLDVLTSDAKRAGKQWACRQLSLIGTEISVPILGKMLTDEETSDMARYALERIPSREVNRILREAMPKAKGKVKVGIINSLGQRRCPKAVGALGELAGGSDEMIADAALAALGQIATADAAKALAKVKGKVSGKLQMVALDSYLKCADQMVADGKKADALKIYKELQDKSLPKPIQTAALRGMLNAMKGN
jgi:type 1 glutamine amidotransferase